MYKRQLDAQKTAVLGYRDQLFLNEEFEKYADVFVATEDGSAGTKGNVMDAIRENALEADVIFACGPTPMLRAIKTYAEEKNIPCWISMEERKMCIRDRYNMYGMDPGMFGGQETLVLNANHPLVQYLASNQEGEHASVICEQLYDLAMISHKQLSPEEMTKFVQRSNEILLLLTK